MKKFRNLLAAVLLLLLLLTGTYYNHGFDRLIFHKITDTFFTDSLKNDALSLHFTLASPEDYGISVKNASLPVYSRQSDAASDQAMRHFSRQLSRIDPTRLKKEDRYSYHLLFSRLKTEEAGQDFAYQEEPLSPSSGMQSELPLLLAEYPFRTRSDVDDYLSILQSVEPYLEGLGAYETEKSEAGLFMTDADAAAVIRQCSSIMDSEALSTGTHFLQKTFETRLDELAKKENLTKEEQVGYLARNQQLLAQAVSPAYQKLSDTLSSLSGSGQYEGGLCEKPDGQAYYAWLVLHTTGSGLDMEEMYSLLQKTFQKKLNELKDLAAQYEACTGHKPQDADLSENFSLSDPSEILADLQQKMQQDFPDLSSLTPEPVNCTIKDVDPALEPYTSPAFYMTPPVDALTSNTICINRASTSDGLELYTTLAHEGYPGHLYQTVYSSLYASVQENQPVRELLYFGGYVEGWAYYTEQLSYGYAAELLTDAESSTAASLLCRMTSLQRDLQINLYSLLDISLHYYGASKADILRSLISFGLPAKSAEQIYNYLRTSPGTYLKYYVGYLEMAVLRERARVQWGKDFSLLRFHQFVLEAGPSDFANLTARLKEKADVDDRGTYSDNQPCADSVRSWLRHRTQ